MLAGEEHVCQQPNEMANQNESKAEEFPPGAYLPDHVVVGKKIISPL